MASTVRRYAQPKPHGSVTLSSHSRKFSILTRLAEMQGTPSLPSLCR